MAKLFNNSKKTYFQSNLGHLRGKNLFFKNHGLSRKTSYRFLTSLKNLEKAIVPIPWKRTDTGTNGHIQF